VSADRIRRLAVAFLNDRRGGAAEFAAVLPVFVAMVLGLMQFGWAQHSASSVRTALEQASRALLLNPSLDQAALEAMVLAKLSPATASEVTVSLEMEAGSGGETLARLTGVYVHEVGLPPFATFPINYSKTVLTPLPPS